MPHRTAHGTAANAARAAAKRAEYARDWADQSAASAAVHFGVHVRTIQQWRTRLGLSRQYTYDDRPGNTTHPPVAGPVPKQERAGQHPADPPGP